MDGGLRGIAERLGFVSTIVIVFGIGAYHGIQVETLTVTFPGLLVRVVAIEAVPATVAFSTIVILSSALLHRDVFTECSPEERLHDGPSVTAIVPVYRDADVLEESVGTLIESTYRSLEIVIACEPGDHHTLSVASDFARHPSVRVMENRYPGSKAGAINDVVERIDTEYVAVFDADERVDPAFIPTAMYHLVDANKDVFQARRVPRVTGPVEAIAYCERVLFHAAYKLVEPIGFTYCRSSSVAVTRDAFETVDGLDHLLTEDIDFAHKCFRAGLVVQQTRNLTNEMEAPHTVRDLWGQRKRWQMGNIQVLCKALRGGYHHDGIRGVLSTFRLLSSIVASVFLVALTAKVAVLVLFNLEGFFLLPFIAVGVLLLPVAYFDYTHGHVKHVSPAMVLTPMIYPGIGMLTLRCAIEYLMSWNGEWYRIEKTGA